MNTIDGPSGQTTTFNYPSGPLSSIVYQASSNAAQLTTGIGISGGQLMSVTEPNPGVMGETQPVTNFTYYPGTDSLETKEDPDLNTTTYSYRYDGTLQTVANPDGSTLGYQSCAVAAFWYQRRQRPGQRGDPAYLVMASTARGTACDGLNNPTTYTFDSYGNVTSVEDPLGNTTLYDRNPSQNEPYTGLVNEMDQPQVNSGGTMTVPVTLYGYDANSAYQDRNLTSETLPDGTVEQWDYDDRQR